MERDLEVDVVVVGFGGAGAAAALQAAECGARVLVIERFDGGGATRMSGGVLYAGGGTPLQRVAGYDDSVKEMFRYLRCETEGVAVPDEVLRHFCERSIEDLGWVESHGVPYPPQGFAPIKTSYPSGVTTLYFSGNEKSPPYCERARPAPRGHRALGKGLTGDRFYEPLRHAVERAGVDVRYRSRATRLLTDEEGAVVGLEFETLSNHRFVRSLHGALSWAASRLGALSLRWLRRLAPLVERIERRHSRRFRVRTKGGVVIAAGGFIFNTEWTRRYIPLYTRTMRLGTMGDDGSGIALGLSVGASLRKMERGTAWMFINPPQALTKGILLSRRGERICNEELYGAVLGERIAEYHDKRAILLLDRAIFREVLGEILSARTASFQTYVALRNLFFNRVKARSLEELERRCGLPSGALACALEQYEKGIDAGQDAFGKSPELLQRLRTPPFYAIDCDTDNPKFATPSISLGGLDTDARIAAVRRDDGSTIGGLWAAGRSAAGICSQHYVSGLSIADAVYSGRNAGRSAAEAAGACATPPVADSDGHAT